MGRGLVLFHVASSSFLASSFGFWEGLREGGTPFPHPNLQHGSTQKDSLCMDLRHSRGLFDTSSVRFGELFCGSDESVDCGNLAGMESFHASKESPFRILSSAPFQLH
jgi:hypothetical protein